MENLPSHYGSYEVPATLRRLFELERELQQEDTSLEKALAFMLLEEDMRYINTPLDVIPFANTGMDGIHYGFLTDFGQVSNLEHAWIVTVSPMNFDAPVWPIASNLHEFLRAVYTDPSALFNLFENGEDYREYALTQDSREFDEEEQEIRQRLAERFGITLIADMGTYLDEKRAQRSLEADLSTEDQVGVVSEAQAAKNEVYARQQSLSSDTDSTSSAVKKNSISKIPTLDRDFDWDERHEELESFWERASSDEKRVFLRNAQLHSIFQHPTCLETFMNRLQRDNYPEYAANLKSSFHYVLDPQPSHVYSSTIMWGSIEIDEADEQNEDD